MDSCNPPSSRPHTLPEEPQVNEAQAKVLRFIVKLSKQPSRRPRACAAVLMAWNRDPDFESVYPVIESYWMAAIGYFERERNFNPARDQDRIVDHILERLATRFTDV